MILSASFSRALRAVARTYQDTGAAGLLARGASGSLGVNVAGAACALLSQILLARFLGDLEYGIYIYVASWLNLLALIIKLGYDRTAIRFLPVYRRQRQWDLFKGLLRQSHVIVFATSALCGLLGAGAAYAVWADSRAKLVTAWIACGILPLLALGQLRQSILQALKHVVQAQFPELVFRPVMIGAAVAALWYVNAVAVSAPIAMGANAAATLLAFTLGTVWMAQRMPGEVRGAAREYETRLWFSVAFPLLLIVSLSMIMKRVDILMIGGIMDTTQAGYYAAAVQLTTLVSFGLTAVNAIAAPMIAELYAEERRAELQGMLRVAALGLIGFTLPACAVMWAAGTWLLGLYGATFTEAYTALAILTFGQMASALSGSVGFLLTMTNHQRAVLVLSTTAACLNILLNAILIPSYGLMGGAIATASCMAFWNIAAYVLVRKYLRLEPTVWAIWRKPAP